MARSRKRTANQPQDVTSGSTIRLESPSSSRQPKTKVLLVTDVNPVGGFVAFLREHAVVGLAIGFVIGTQVQSVVKQLVSSFIDPLFLLLFGKALSQRTFTLQWHARTANFGWGSFVYGLLDFVFVLFAIYIIIALLKLDQLDKPKEDKK